MTPDPEEILDRMRSDLDSDWADRLLRDLGAARLVDESSLPSGLPRSDGLALSPTERRVVEALAHGLSYDEAAVALGIGMETVQTHLKRARRKLRAKNTTHLCALAVRQKIIG